MSTKTLSLRKNDSDYRFLSGLAKEEGEDISKTVRELIDLGRVALAKNTENQRHPSKKQHIWQVSLFQK